MITLSTHQALDLTIYEVDQWDLPVHCHQFLEIIYVLEGRGTHTINHNSYSYEVGSLYLLTPHDAHTFVVHEPSRFCILVITELYVRNSAHSLTSDAGSVYKQLEYIFLNHNQTNGEPVRQLADQQWMQQLMQRLMAEVEQPVQHEAVVQHLVALLLHQVARSIRENNRLEFTVAHPHNLAYDISSYIQQHIYDNEKLRLAAIAEAFYKSKNTLSQHFKTQTGETIKEYILSYKLNLVKARLQFSDLTISQIADEVGFTDESHLNKAFRQRVGSTATEFRRRHRQEKLVGN
ncbi:AraC family transcriptional regulator [Hymenobacter sp. BT664]|uniref:AraC family transcriptional regulator n=1 Tax=Hymenobacter montanus TaxID=2771359 RepID=A0A927BFN1_9BACT|nr:AraC family transcriptional regulator [Hymenobacter montanus]MBD2770016.1 AraC family transcriptional regulator [Hymenobacter montanus]